MEHPADTIDPSSPSALPVTVYWRPGCGFCARLRRNLASSGLVYDEINIWEVPDAAAFVREHARGNETVPTVTIGERTVVNPSADEVLELAGVTPTGHERTGRIARLFRG